MPTSHREHAKLATMLGMAVGACAVGAPAAAQTGGMPVPEPVAPSTGPTGYGNPGTRAIVVAPTAMVGGTVFVRGTMPRAARRQVILQRLDPERGWRNEARGRVRSNARFLIRWKADRAGRLSLRVVIAPRGHSSRAAPPPIAQVNVYRASSATFYGPGLYGNTTACGQVLTPQLLGVAHKHLKCGTLVAILYERREVIVPVVDRGPFREGYSWDLTQATADALAFTGAAQIGYIRVAPTR